MNWEFKELGYDFNALEPFIDEKTMQVHYLKHYKTYHEKALQALNGDTKKSVEQVLLTDKSAVMQNNGGGFYNHTIFWEILGKNNGGAPFGRLAQLIDKDFGSFNLFKEKFANAALTLFGSGWVFLLFDEKMEKLEIIQRHNQDHPLCGKKVLMGLDVWEHAYYLKYQNRRADYIEAFWNVVDFKKVALRLEHENAFIVS
jgi:Fe-Mn family superoxide dismutase